MPQTPSTRWCPTPEQLMILEELYRSGVKTPNATQIQQITAHLSLYGKIEGKNVFYWFQNHKARDRQKLRRKLSRQQQMTTQHESGPISPSAAPSLQYQMPPQLMQQGFLQEITNPGMNLMDKLGEEETTASNSTDLCSSSQWMASMDLNSAAFPPCCRPLKTLDLFPVTGTSMKDECSSSKSSSCSTSTN